MIPIEDLTDVTLAIEEVMKVIKRWKLSTDESYQLMKVISDESYLREGTQKKTIFLGLSPK